MGNASSTCDYNSTGTVTFNLYDNYTNVYAVDPTTNTTKYAESGSATTFSSFFYGVSNPEWPLIDRFLGLNETNASGETVLFVANVNKGADNPGGAITFAQIDNLEDGFSDSDQVGANLGTCELGLYFTSGWDISSTFDCGGKISLFIGTAHPDCRRVYLTYTIV